MSEEHPAPKVVLDVIDALALPTISSDELRRETSQWSIVSNPPIDIACAFAKANLTAADVVIVELVTERASVADVWNGFTSARLIPGGVIDALRVLAATELSQWQAFPFMCLGSDATFRKARSPMVDCAGETTVVVSEVSLYDDEAKPELGWSDHCLVIARHAPVSPASAR